MKSADYLFLPSPALQNLEEWKRKLEESYLNLRDDILANTVFRKAVSTDYEMRSRDSYIGVTDTSAARTITLPPSDRVDEAREYIIQDESGEANVNNITVAAHGNDKINGVGSKTINTQYGFIKVIRGERIGINWFTI